MEAADRGALLLEMVEDQHGHEAGHVSDDARLPHHRGDSVGHLVDDIVPDGDQDDIGLGKLGLPVELTPPPVHGAGRTPTICACFLLR
jgi:hypothetical protein